MDLFRTESILLKSHWILVIMDQFTRRIIGFGVQAVAVDGQRSMSHVQPGHLRAGSAHAAQYRS